MKLTCSPAVMSCYPSSSVMAVAFMILSDCRPCSLTDIYSGPDFQRCRPTFLHSLGTLSTCYHFQLQNTSNAMYPQPAPALALSLLVSHVMGQTQCPSVWGTVATDLNAIFSGDNGCTDDARAAIRLPFHDCFPGACDGSIILSDECTARGENSQLVDICSTLGAKATEYNVSTADMIQVAGGRTQADSTHMLSTVD